MGKTLPYQDELILLNHLKEGRITAFHFIYDTHYQPLFHFATRLVKDPDQAEDIIAECFITLWQKKAEFETFKGLTAFLYTCTRNASLTYLNKNRRHAASHLEIAFLSGQSDFTDQAREIKNDLVHYAIIESQKLPAGMKKIFQLIYIEGFSTAETAKTLNKSIHTIRAQKTSAIKKVREALVKKGLLGLFLLWIAYG